MKRLLFFIYVLLISVGLHAQVAKTSTQAGCINYRAGEEPLLNVPACRKAAIHAQTVKPALPANAVPVEPSGWTLTSQATANTTAVTYLNLTVSAMATMTTATADSFYVTDAKGPVAVCKNHDLDKNTFTGCRLVEGRTLDELMDVVFKELQR